jgi:hypothetical protein
MTREGESGPFARVALIQGRSPPPAPEIAELLQRRLRVGAQLIVMAIGLFFVRDYLLGQRPQNLWMRVGMLVVVVALFAYLHPRQLSMRQARIAEMFGFGILIAWFSHNEYVHLLGWARQGEQSAVLFTLTSEVLAFYVVMSGYAMFIPNTWRRALLICGSMALVPFATLGVIRAFHPDEFDVIAASALARLWASGSPYIGPYILG